jgi:hypothetical protein
MISNSKPTEPEPEQSQDENILLTNPGRAGEGNADMANAGMANAGVANAGTGIGEPRPPQIEPEPEFWPEPQPSPDQPKQQQKLKWSKEKRDAVISRTRRGIEKPAENWGTNDELEVLAKMFGIRFVLSETAQAAELQRITIGEDGSPTIFSSTQTIDTLTFLYPM